MMRRHPVASLFVLVVAATDVVYRLALREPLRVALGVDHAR